MSDLHRAREAAASTYPEFLTDTKGRQHPSIPRKAILSGAWDHGAVVRRYMGEGRHG